MILDYPSILLFLAINNLFIIALYAYQYLYHHKKRHLFVFILGILFQTIALVLVGNRDRLPFLFSVQISNLFLISSFALTSFGLISFDGKTGKKIGWLFFAVTILAYSFFLAVAENTNVRIIIQIIASSFFYGFGAFYLFMHKKKYKFSKILSVILFAYSIFQLVRASIIIHIGESYNFMDGSMIDNCYLVISVFVISASSIGLIMLLKEIDQNTILKKNTRIQQDKLKLEELNATKDKLFSIIAHDLRSPFSGIIGLSEILMGNLKDFEPEKSEKYLEFINSSAKSTFNLLDNLLTWAKSQTGQVSFNPEKLVLSSIIKEVLKLSISNAKGKNISLTYKQSGEDEVYVDKNMLMIVFRNLISNALKFSHRGGNVNISTITKKSLVEISISDDGVGIDEESRTKLFDISENRTSTGTDNEKGSGLGLVLCKEFVEKQGGNIRVESILGKGSIFKFTIPLSN